MKLIGLTGGIACGKSTVSRALAAQVRAPAAWRSATSSQPATTLTLPHSPAPSWLPQGFTIIDADAIARTVVDKGRWGYRRVVRAFGSSILRSDGEPGAGPGPACRS